MLSLQLFGCYHDKITLDLDDRCTEGIPEDERPRLARITLNPATGEASLQVLTATVGDFPTINPNYQGVKSRCGGLVGRVRFAQMVTCALMPVTGSLINQSKRKTSYAIGQTNLGHKHTAPDHSEETTQPMVDLPTHQLRLDATSCTPRGTNMVLVLVVLLVCAFWKCYMHVPKATCKHWYSSLEVPLMGKRIKQSVPSYGICILVCLL